jgi:hypothetical protein
MTTHDAELLEKVFFILPKTNKNDNMRRKTVGDALT